MTTQITPEAWETFKPIIKRVTPEAWEAYRSVFRALGPRHRIIDRWRHDLGWNCQESAVGKWLATERAKLTEEAGHAD